MNPPEEQGFRGPEAEPLRQEMLLAEPYWRAAGPDVHPAVRSLRGFSNLALKQWVTGICGALRLLERERQRQRRAGNEDSGLDIGYVYSALLHPVAVNIQIELLRRVADEITPDGRNHMLESGRLAGADPLGDAASYLEKLARLMPDTN